MIGARLERGGTLSKVVDPDHFSGFLARADH
jgi:hypothetical protein